MAVKASVPERPAAPRSYPYGGLVAELGGLDENKVCSETSFIEETTNGSLNFKGCSV
jgi:hypothetical protein